MHLDRAASCQSHSAEANINESVNEKFNLWKDDFSVVFL